MKRVLTVSVFLLLCTGGVFAKETQQWSTPAIKGYGAIIYNPDLKIEPDASLDYKVIFKITSGDLKNGVNAQLWHVARLVNLLADGNIKQEKMHIVAGIAGKATPVVLSDAAYEKRYKKPNPNTELIRELTKAGVRIYVCSQAAAEHDIDMKRELNPNIIPSLSLMTDLVNFQLKGYVLMP